MFWLFFSFLPCVYVDDDDDNNKEEECMSGETYCKDFLYLRSLTLFYARIITRKQK